MRDVVAGAVMAMLMGYELIFGRQPATDDVPNLQLIFAALRCGCETMDGAPCPLTQLPRHSVAWPMANAWEAWVNSDRICVNIQDKFGVQLTAMCDGIEKVRGGKGLNYKPLTCPCLQETALAEHYSRRGTDRHGELAKAAHQRACMWCRSTFSVHLEPLFPSFTQTDGKKLAQELDSLRSAHKQLELSNKQLEARLTALVAEKQ